MNRLLFLFIFSQYLVSNCFGEISLEEKDRLVNGFVDFYNKLPNQIYSCEEGYLQYAQQTDPNHYSVEVKLKVKEVKNPANSKNLKCTGDLQDSESGLMVLRHHCEDSGDQEKLEEEVTEDVVVTVDPETEDDATDETATEDPVRRPVVLDNEVQTDTAVTSGEQFIAVPRKEAASPCIGCSSHVNPNASGVWQLAQVGVRQLDALQPNVLHTLKQVVAVERQVQIVNGVRYILTLLVNYNSCQNEEGDLCLVVKPCKISILEKPWERLHDGSKYRAVVANNCTEQWTFGDEGMLVTEPHSKANDPDPNNDGGPHETVKVVNNLQSQRTTPKPLTEDDIKNIEEQIIVRQQTHVENAANVEHNDKDHPLKEEVTNSPNSIPAPKHSKVEPLSDDKKKAVDELMNFFTFSGLDDLLHRDDTTGRTRMKRSYQNDLNVLQFAEKYHKLKSTLESAKYIYKLAQLGVDYQNEIDKSKRVLKDVLTAEDEYEDKQHFYYIQYRTVIPCKTNECSEKSMAYKICNCVIDASGQQLHVLNQFCHEDKKKKPIGKVVKVAIDDPVLINLVTESLKKIENESTSQNALQLRNIIDANTQTVSGSVTKISIIYEYLNCNKTVPVYARKNCSRIDEMGSQICEVIVHERNKDKKISYACTDRPVESSFSNIKMDNIKKNVNDPVVRDMVQEALRQLEFQSNKRNKQIVIKINSVSTKLVSGFLTDIEFVVGYTTCSSEVIETSSDCKLLDNTPLRICNAKVWDRSWIEDGRQIDVSCKHPHESNDETKKLNRSFDFIDDFSGSKEYALRKKRAIMKTDNISETIEYSKKDLKVVKRHTQLYGDPRDQNPNDPQYLKLAQESMNKYLESVKVTIPHTVEEVYRVRTQLVAGKMTRIDFRIAPTDGNTGDALTCHSEIWEKTWEKFKQIDVNCSRIRVQRGVTGGQSEKNPKDPKYLKLAQESMNKYLEFAKITVPHTVVEVTKVSTQVVAGKMTRIDFRIAPTGGSNSDALTCNSKIWEKDWNNFKQIDVGCGKVRVKIGVTGGQSEKNPKDPKYLKLAEESMNKFLESAKVAKPHTVVAVTRVTTQVVAGRITRIDFSIAPTDGSNIRALTCHSEIWEKPWKNFKQIDVYCGKVRAKRGGPGSQSEKNPKDPQYLVLAQESMNKYLESAQVTIPHMVEKVTDVTTQTVAGEITRITFFIAPASEYAGDILECRSEIWEKPWENFKEIAVTCNTLMGGETQQNPKDPQYLVLAQESMNKYLESAQVTIPHTVEEVTRVRTGEAAGKITRVDFHIAPTSGYTGDVLSCHSEIWEKPWEHFKQIDVNCGRARAKRGVPGGQSIKNPKDPKYLKLAQESMIKYLESTQVTIPHMVEEVTYVTTQIVAGEITRIDFRIAPAGASPSDALTCHSEIWEKPWEKFKLIDVNCGRIKAQRGVTGGQSEKNPKDPKYLKLAQESMIKYLESAQVTIPHMVEKVTDVTTQTVAGEITRITFFIAPASEYAGDILECHSEIWEKPWENFKEIAVTCNTLMGGETQQNPKDPQYLVLAQESMNKYLESAQVTIPHTVEEVTRVRTGEAAGKITRVDFHIAPTSGYTGDVLSCHSEIWEKPWEHFKQIDVNCGRVRAKRGVTGGQSEKNPKDPKYLKLAQESMIKYLESAQVTIPHMVEKVTHVTTQTVAGEITRITFFIAPASEYAGDILGCHSEIWEKPWENFKEIAVTCNTLMGGETQQNPKDPQYIELAQESMNKYLESAQVTIPHTVEEVYRVRTQLVAGEMTRIDFGIAPTDGNTGDALTCHSVIWVKEWEKFKQIEVNCGSLRAKIGFTGGQSEQNPKDPEYLKLAHESMNKYLESAKVAIPHTVVAVTRVTTQVVAGRKTRVDFDIAPTSGYTGDVLSCHSEIWEMPWEHFKQIDVNCGRVRAKRGVTGGQSEKNPKDPKYLKLAQESMIKYLESAQVTIPHMVEEVTHVTTQIVAGEITRIDFRIAPAGASPGDALTCHSEIWEKPWEKFKQIDVNCGRIRAQRGVTGGQSEKNPKDPKYLKLAQESMIKYLESAQVTIPHMVEKVTDVTTQTVAGEITRITFFIAPASEYAGDILGCHSEIWEKPWENFKEIAVTCNTLMGGETQQNPKDPQYLVLAQESMNKYLESAQVTIPHTVEEVTRVRTGEAAGKITRVDFHIAPTSGYTGDVLSCHSEIWEKPWEHFKQIDVNCGRVRAKRGVTGGQSEKNPKDPKYLKLAQESMIKYLESAQVTIPHMVEKVTDVTTQTVAGEITRITFFIAPASEYAGDILGCHSEIWEKPWENFKEIAVTCNTLMGGETQQNPKDPQYIELAQESMNKYLESAQVTIPHTVEEVYRVRTQLVAGEMTRIDFGIAPTDGNTGDALTCHSVIWVKEWEKFKQIEVNCGSLRAKIGFTGGQSEQNPKDPEYLKLAHESMNKYLESAKVAIPHTVVAVTRVTTQVVAGRKTRVDFDIAPTSGYTGDVLSCHSEIWEMPWEHFKQIDVNCGRVRAKRGVTGGQSEKNPKDPKYLKLAQESMIKYLESAQVTIPHMVEEVTHVTTQIVAGEITRIDFRIAPAGASPGDALTCHSEIWEKPWEKFKQIDVNCGRIRAQRGVTGGQSEKNPKDPKYLKLAQESMIKYLESAQVTIPHMVEKVTDVTTQTVAGEITRITFFIAPASEYAGDILECHSEIWEKPWENFKEIAVTCNTLMGGETQQNPKDPQYLVLAQESMNKYLESAQVTIPHTVEEVTRVRTGEAAGKITRVDFHIAPTSGYTGDVLSCHSEIWEKPWEHFKQIDVNCGRVRAKRGVTGGQSEKNPKDPKYLKLAHESMNKYLESAKVAIPHTVVAVTRVTTQVVAGRKTRVDFDIAPTSGYTGDVLSCHSEIWEMPWEHFKQIDVNCGRVRAKRGVTGGQSEKNPKDPKYLKLAQESMIKYLESAQVTIPHMVEKVTDVTTQTVAGEITRITFFIAPASEYAGDILGCHSEIWEKPWENFKEIAVTCNTLMGGETQQNPKDPQYLVLAQESMNKYLESAQVTIPHTVEEVTRVRTGEAAGKITRVDFHIAPTSGYTGDVLSCHSEIWEKPWEHFKQIDVNCGRVRAKRGVTGGQSEKNPKDPKYLKLAQESMIKYLESAQVTIPHMVEEVTHVTTQIVAGEITRIDFRIAPAGASPSDALTCHSEIWEKQWEKFKQIDVNCGRIRAQRGVTGGQSEKNPKDPKYLKLAQESMIKYLESAQVTIPHMVEEVTHVTTQTVAGEITRISFLIAPASEYAGDILGCQSEIWEKPWENFKEIAVTCNTLMGGETQQNPKDPQYSELARESMNKYLESAKVAIPHTVVAVTRVTTQVVAGRITRVDFHIAPTSGYTGDVLSCHSEIWEKSWEHFKQIEVNCGRVRAKRDTFGGQSDQNPKDPLYLKLAQESMNKYLESAELTVPHTVVEVIKVTTQVVAGKMTRIDFRIAPTGASTGDALTCHSKIWEKPRKQFKDITVKCTKQKKKLNTKYLRGGVQEQDPTDPKFKKLAEEALQRYNKLQNLNLLHVVEIKKVTSQIVSGIKYNIGFVVAYDSCDNHANCTLNCAAEITSRAAVQKKEIEISCKNIKSRRARSVNQLEYDLENDIAKTSAIEISKLDNKRQALEDEEINEDIKFYYADRAMEYVNNRYRSNNLYKLVTLHNIASKINMGVPTVRMYIEVAETYCIRKRDEAILPQCEELDGMNHKLCLIRLFPSADDELVIKSVTAVCEGDNDFETVSGLSIKDMLLASIVELERHQRYKLVHQGEPQLVPTLDSRMPHVLNFIVAYTNCTKDIDVYNYEFNCYIDARKPSKACRSRVWVGPNSKNIRRIDAKCSERLERKRRAMSNSGNVTTEEATIKKLVKESLHKLEMSSAIRYKQRLIKINSYSTKLTTGKVTTIDFDVGYTSCLKFEWVENEKTCEFIPHLPRKHCVSQIWERLWLDNGRNIEVTCEDEEEALETFVQFDSVDTATGLADQALKFIEAKYPHPRKQKVIRIFSLEKQVVAGIHYRMKLEIGLTNCTALSVQTPCRIDSDIGLSKFCRVNAWLRPWTDHPPNFRVNCDYQEAATTDFYHHLQSEFLFHDFLTTYKPDYINNHGEMMRRFEIFKENVQKIHELNTHEKGTARYGVTRFADLSYEEFTSKYLGLKPNMSNPNFVPMREAVVPEVELPEQFDWRDSNAVTEVKDQGSCGSCWAFSVTGNIEGQWKLKSGKLVSLSEQELVDCDKLDQGCNGGLPDNAYRAIEELGGLETETDYPYEGEDDKCSFNKSLSRVQISGAVNITTNETDMAKWLVKNGPISIAINANAMQFYIGGVSHPWKMLCNPKNLDHGVLIVGFGIKDYPLFHKKLPYWIIKNSWGKSWGEQGYYRVFRGDGTCGVNQMASSAVI